MTILRNTLAITFVFAALSSACLQAQSSTASVERPWQNISLSPDRRADLVLEQMTLDEKLQMVHGTGWGVLRAGSPVPAESNHGAGFVPGIPRLGIPKIDEADSAVGVRMAALDSRYATLLPSVLGLASSWDTSAAKLYGMVIGRELRAQGFNMSIGGGVNLTREPRNGRNFEYAGEDPILAGTTVGQLALGVQSQHVMGDIKHYAFNDQETGRTTVNVVMDKRTMRETDLFAFEIAIKMAQPAGVMCSYNRVNGDHTCESDYLLNEVLKRDFGFKGWVLSDWEATHSTVKAALSGLDQEMPGDDYFGPPLRRAIASGAVPMARLDDMVHRILRSMFATGVVDDPPSRRVVDPFQGREDARHIAEESIVLLKNDANTLPLNSVSVHRVALIGGHADIGVLSGGGSAQVDAPGGNAIDSTGRSAWGKPVYFRSSPMKAMEQLAPGVEFRYDPGTDPAAAAALARSCDVAIVFATQYMTESVDAPSLSLPDGQDGLVGRVAAANPRTVVVLETGGPVSMPWIGQVGAVLEAWYPGIGGGEAIADLVFGRVNPSAKLPITFAKTDADLPEVTIAGRGLRNATAAVDGSQAPSSGLDLHYTQGLAVGYRWYEATKRAPLFAFGHGLSYTSFRYSGLTADAATKTVRFELRNTGAVDGTEVAQVYALLPTAAGEPFHRLVAWQRVALKAGEARTVTMALDPAYLSIFDEKADGWKLLPGSYGIEVGGSSDRPAVKVEMEIR